MKTAVILTILVIWMVFVAVEAKGIQYQVDWMYCVMKHLLERKFIQSPFLKGFKNLIFSSDEMVQKRDTFVRGKTTSTKQKVWN